MPTTAERSDHVLKMDGVRAFRLRDLPLTSRLGCSRDTTVQRPPPSTRPTPPSCRMPNEGGIQHWGSGVKSRVASQRPRSLFHRLMYIA